MFAIVFMLATISYANSQEDNHKDDVSKQLEMSDWEKEGFKKISNAAGVLLYFSGELLEESDKKRNSGNEEGEDEDFKGAYALPEIAANYAKDFEVFCKK